MDFLKAFWVKNGDVYFGSWFNGRHVDPLQILIWQDWLGQLSLPDYKLATVCRHYGIELGDQAHDALADVRAARALIKRLCQNETAPAHRGTEGPEPLVPTPKQRRTGGKGLR